MATYNGIMHVDRKIKTLHFNNIKKNQAKMQKHNFGMLFVNSMRDFVDMVYRAAANIIWFCWSYWCLLETFFKSDLNTKKRHFLFLNANLY